LQNFAVISSTCQPTYSARLQSPSDTLELSGCMETPMKGVPQKR
jgi:hypothetical protein